MKLNFGVYFHIAFGSLTFALGIYFLHQISFLSLLFFIATLSSIFLVYREYSIQRRMLADLSMLENLDELRVKKSKSITFTNLLSYFIFIILSVFFINLIIKKDIDDLRVFLVLPVGIIILCMIRIFADLRKINTTVLLINKKGIQVNEKPLMEWVDITNEKIITRTFTDRGSRHQLVTDVDFLFFYFKVHKIEVNVQDLDITDGEINHYLKVCRDRYTIEN